MEDSIPEFFFVPPTVKARVMPSGIKPILGAGIFVESSLENAMQIASDRGLILPRKIEDYVMLSTEELVMSERKSTQSGWTPIVEKGFVLCHKSQEKAYRLLDFDNMRDYCKHRNGETCEKTTFTCYEEGCEPWKKEFQKVTVGK